MSLEDLFCDVDDFCRQFLPNWHRQQDWSLSSWKSFK